MSGIVTRHYLRQRFWVAAFVLLAALVVSAGIMILAMTVQADKGNYLAALQHLDIAATRLERELSRLSIVPEGGVADRQKARSAFVGLLTEFRAISASGSDEPEASAPGSADSRAGDHLAGLWAEFGVDTAPAMARRRIGGGSMPQALEEIWERGESGSRSGAPPALEIAFARLFRLTAPLVRGEGGLASAERRRLREIETLSIGQIRPTLTRAVKILDAARNRIGQTWVICILALAGFGVAAALLGFFAIFRPLERTVMASQGEIISERDEAVAARIAKRNFLSVVSHELRTPMNGVLGFASLLLASDLKSACRWFKSALWSYLPNEFNILLCARSTHFLRTFLGVRWGSSAIAPKQ